MPLKAGAVAPKVVRPDKPRTPVPPKQLMESGVDNMPANAVSIRGLIIAKRLDDALKVADIVLTTHPNDVEVGMQRARLLFWRGQLGEAEKQAVHVYRNDRFNREALRLVGEIRSERGDLKGAVRAYREAQLRGDADIVLVFRLIHLYLELDRPDLALAQLRPGMQLPDELARMLAAHLYPWTAQVLGGVTLYGDDVWRRAGASLGYRWSPMLTVLGGAQAEQRTGDRVGFQTFAQIFVTAGRFAGDLRFAWSPQTGDFLPPIDTWLSGAFSFDKFALGLWGRYANFEISPLYSVGPFAVLYFGNWELKPGYLLVWRGETPRGGGGQVGHTVFLKSRWDYDANSAFLFWAYYGEEAVFNERTVRIPDESGLSLVVGWEKWLTARWGVRLMGTWTTPFNLADNFWDLVVAVRVRL